MLMMDSDLFPIPGPKMQRIRIRNTEENYPPLQNVNSNYCFKFSFVAPPCLPDPRHFNADLKNLVTKLV